MFQSEAIRAAKADTVRVRQLRGRVVVDKLEDRNAARFAGLKGSLTWKDYESALSELSEFGFWVELVNPPEQESRS